MMTRSNLLGTLGKSVPLHLLIIILISGFFHTVSILSDPIRADPDSMGYFLGASTLAKKLSFDGVSGCRGPGMSIIFAPHLYLFGSHSTWPIKITFHLFALGQVVLVYGIARVLTGGGLFAFLCGIIAALSPSLVSYGNRLLSEVPSGFFAMLSTYIAVLYLREKKQWQLFSAAACLSFATLLRPENLLLLLVFFVVAIVALFVDFRKNTEPCKSAVHHFLYLGLAVVVAVIPLLMWSTHNYRVWKHFALTTYTDIALYDGWIDFARHYKVKIPIESSEAMQTIDHALQHHKQITIGKGEQWDERKVIGWHAYYDYAALLAKGMSNKEANDIMLKATTDFIKYYAFTEPITGLFLIRQKMENIILCPVPLYWADSTSPLKGEAGYLARPAYPGPERSFIEDYVSLEHTQFRLAILLQRKINRVYVNLYANERFRNTLYEWQAISLLGFITLLFMKPFRVWIIFSLFTFSKIMVPAIVSWSQLRLALPGLLLFFILAMVFSRQIIIYVLAGLFSRFRGGATKQ